MPPVSVTFSEAVKIMFQIDKILERFDENGDGKLDYQEFKKLVKR